LEVSAEEKKTGFLTLADIYNMKNAFHENKVQKTFTSGNGSFFLLTMKESSPVPSLQINA